VDLIGATLSDVKQRVEEMLERCERLFSVLPDEEQNEMDQFVDLMEHHRQLQSATKHFRFSAKKQTTPQEENDEIY
jgi:hypothetical protein